MFGCVLLAFPVFCKGFQGAAAVNIYGPLRQKCVLVYLRRHSALDAAQVQRELRFQPPFEHSPEGSTATVENFQKVAQKMLKTSRK